MAKHGWRASLGAVSIVLSSAAGVITNIATEETGTGWWVFLVTLVGCMVGLHFFLSSQDRDAAAEGSGPVGPRHRQPPADGPGPRAGDVTVRAGRDVLLGLRGQHPVQVALIIAAVAVLSPTVVLLLSRDASPASSPALPSVAPGVSTKLSGPSASPPPGVRVDAAGVITFKLELDRGHAYDLDIGPDESPYKNYGAAEWEPDDSERDLYLSGQAAVPGNWWLYVPRPPKRSEKRNGFMLAKRGAAGRDCRDPAFQGAYQAIKSPGNAAVGVAGCLKTNRGHWAMVELLGLPERPGDKLPVEVTLYP